MASEASGQHSPEGLPPFEAARIPPDDAALAPHILQGDCLEVIPRAVGRQAVDLVVTSPPYADQRRKNYGGIHPDRYVEWFLPRAEVIRDSLRPTGSFVLNIKERAVNGERHPYVLELILALRKQGWRWVDEYCWHKKNAYPRQMAQSLSGCLGAPAALHPQQGFQDAAGSGHGADGAVGRTARLRRLSATDTLRDESRHDNGFGKKVENWVGRDRAYPTNVLHMATECGYRGHPACFPEQLPAWFIKLFTDEGDTVLDPFAGSGTTLVAAQKLRRMGIGIDTSAEYCAVIASASPRRPHRHDGRSAVSAAASRHSPAHGISRPPAAAGGPQGGQPCTPSLHGGEGAGGEANPPGRCLPPTSGLYAPTDGDWQMQDLPGAPGTARQGRTRHHRVN